MLGRGQEDPWGLQVGPRPPWLRGLLGFLRVCVFPGPQFPRVLFWHQASLKKASGFHLALRAVLDPRLPWINRAVFFEPENKEDS